MFKRRKQIENSQLTIRASCILKLSCLPNSLEHELQIRGHFLDLSMSSSPTLFNVADYPEVNVTLYWITLWKTNAKRKQSLGPCLFRAQWVEFSCSLLPSHGSALNRYEMCYVYLTLGTHTRWTFSSSVPFSLAVYSLRK